MIIARYAKIAMVLCLAAFCLLVTFNNLTDYDTNYLFVQHVLSMDTTFSGNALMYRSITHPVLVQVAYGVIIAAEAAVGVNLPGTQRKSSDRSSAAPIRLSCANSRRSSASTSST